MPISTLPLSKEANTWHDRLAADVIAAWDTDATRGLSDAQARAGLERHGPNALPEAATRGLLAVFLGQFANPLIYLLFGAAAIALALGHAGDTAIIAIVVGLNAAIGTYQEGRAERSMAALRRLSDVQARVVRDGQEARIPAREVVPGDILIIEAGDAIAADARLFEAASLTVAEAALTGESLPVTKDPAPCPVDTPFADRAGMVHAGTHVAAGRGRAVVIATGSGTEIGHIATLAGEAKEPPTPLERRIAGLGRSLLVLAAVLFVVILAVGLARGVPPTELLMIAVSQVVSLIPEGLPVAMTIALAIGVRRMADRHAVVRRLAAVEALGSTTVICTDKTGTLTANAMTATRVVLAGGRVLAVSGVGYAPAGGFHDADGQLASPATVPGLGDLLEAGLLCNDARLVPTPDGAGWSPLGDPTEAALVTLAIKGGLDPDVVAVSHPRRMERPFDPDVRLMATAHGAGPGRRVVLKGAPEAVLALCGAERGAAGDRPLDPATRQAWAASAEELAGRALRVLAIAEVPGHDLPTEGWEPLHGHAVLLGLIGQHDPPRPEAAAAVASCRAAGVRPVMVTGDHLATGLAIATELGIARPGDAAIDGRELERMTDAELTRRIDDIAVFARVHPAQKLRIVTAFQARGEVVAMTGDGVNDAPALVKADVGVAMGQSGTEVAKEAAKIVLVDDDFSTLVGAIQEGRVVYRNIKKVLLLLFSTAAAEVAVLMLAMLLGFPPPFGAVQILWNNLVTEGLITINLVMEPAEGDEMQRRPTAPDEPLLTGSMAFRMALMAGAITVSTLGWFVYRSAAGIPTDQVRTEAFTLLAICEWYNVLNCRSERRSALSLSLLRNPWLVGGLVVGNALQALVVFWPPLGQAFHTVPFGLDVVLELAVVGSLVLWVEEARKLVARRASR